MLLAIPQLQNFPPIFSFLSCFRINYYALKQPFLFQNVLSCLETSFPILEHPFLFWNILSYFGTSSLVLKYPFLFQKVLFYFRMSYSAIYHSEISGSFKHVVFWPKIYLILYPSFGNLTTHIAIEYTSKRNRSYLGINNQLEMICAYLIIKRILSRDNKQTLP